MKLRLSRLLLILSTTLMPSLVMAQIDRTEIDGTVKDQSGAVIEGTSVLVTQADTGLRRELSTNRDGIYTVPSLSPCTYTLTFAKEGFQKTVFQDVLQTAGQTRTLNVTLAIRAQAQAISVVDATAAALDETTATFGGSVQPVQVSKVPINGRNWSTLETLVPGAVNLGTGGQSSIRFAGQAMDDANYRLDGNDMTGIQNAAPKSALRLQVSTEAINLVVVMSADHGVSPVPEVNVARRMPGGRVDKAAYTRAVQDALDTRFGKARWIIGSWESGFYFDQNLIRERKLNPSDVEDEAARAIADLPYVERTYTRTQLLNREAVASLPDDYVARSFFPARGPDLFVIFKPYWLFGKEGTSHGSPWDYDTHVPLLFFGAGIQPGVYTERVGISDVAPTLAALLHVETPSGNVGHILPEIVAPSRLPSSVSSSRGR
jgi:hypothetical protein